MLFLRSWAQREGVQIETACAENHSDRSFRYRGLTTRLFFASLMVAACGSFLKAQQPSPQPVSTREAASQPSSQSQPDIPVIDGGLGPCSLELQVNDGNAKPVVSADVKVHITYGFMGVRKMDLEANTSLSGKVKFAGLPAKVHNPPLEFRASKDQRVGLATYNPATECQAKHDIVLEKLKASDASTPSPTP
jgi:hypothetical protein